MNQQPEKYIITGHEGFIGNRLVRRLGKENIIGWERFDSYSEDTISALIPKIAGIFHIGACADTREDDVNVVFGNNVMRSVELFELAKKHNKKVVFASSSAIYGNEQYPTNYYSWSKYCAEAIGKEMLHDFVGLRFFNVYGPGEEHKELMSSIPYHIYHSETFSIFPNDYNNLSPQRDFVYVEDVVDACIYSMENDISGVYDVGTGEAIPYDIICKLFGRKYEYGSVDQKPIGYQDYTCANPKKFLPDWNPKKIEEGVKLYKEYLDGQ